MGTPKHFPQLKLFFLACALMWLPAARAMTPFTITDIRAQGLQRLEIGTVLTYLPLAVGDEVNEITLRQSMRSLYGSGLFQDVQLEREGTTLVIRVKERPAIASFTIDGNDKVGGDDIKETLAEAGLAEGELFKRDLLSEVEQELRRQYFANGYYDVEIETTVEELPNNLVILEIQVIENKVTRIKQINILGNTVFPESELKDAFKLAQSKPWVPFQRSDKYSKQQLVGDLESLSSYYQDRGYLKFNVSSVQVQLSPDKQDIYVTINVSEGDVYTIKDHRFSGDTILTPRTLEILVSTSAGQTFSRKEATESADRIEAALSDIGYAFAEVTPLPEVDEETREVSLNYFVQPGKRAYVRRINFSGHTGTNDETLRREMRQLEASPFSKSAVERSRVRLARLPFVEEAEVETQPVAGTSDLVDINFAIKERPPGSLQFGLGYSGSQGFLLNGSITHSNFLGTGNRIGIEASNSSIIKSVNLSWTDPYFTADGVSQTASVFYREADRVIRTSSGFNYNLLGANLTYGIPLSEYVSLRAGAGIQETSMDTFPNNSSDEILAYVVENGAHFTTYQLRTGIARDTRNRTFFATRGSLQSLSLDVAVPGSDVEYYSATWRATQYVPLFYKFFLELDGNVGIVDELSGGGTEVPPYEHLFAGGAKTVRGYRDGSLGPRDTPFDNPYGGRFRTTLQNELIIPLPIEANQKSVRLSAFYDIGQVFAEMADFDSSELRSSAGMSLQWFTPFFGLLELSYAFPLDDEPTDEVDRFQITFGTGF